MITDLEEEKKKNESELHQACLDRSTDQIKKLGQKSKEIYDQIEALYEEMEQLMDAMPN